MARSILDRGLQFRTVLFGYFLFKEKVSPFAIPNVFFLSLLMLLYAQSEFKIPLCAQHVRWGEGCHAEGVTGCVVWLLYTPLLIPLSRGECVVRSVH